MKVYSVSLCDYMFIAHLYLKTSSFNKIFSMFNWVFLSQSYYVTQKKMIFQNLNELFESFCYRRLNKLVSVQSIYLVKYNNETILVIYLQIYFIYDMQSANIGAVNFNTIFIIFTTFLIIRLLSTIRHFRTVVIMNG